MSLGFGVDRERVASALRVCGLAGLPVILVAAALFFPHSKRQVAVFLASFSLQSTLLGWLYLYTLDQRLGRWSATYLSFVAAVWTLFLGGQESATGEWVFNAYLHYAQPAYVVAYWLLKGDRSTGIPWPLQLYPFLYLVALVPLGYWLGYQTYPVLTSQTKAVAVVWAGVHLVFNFLLTEKKRPE